MKELNGPFIIGALSLAMMLISPGCTDALAKPTLSAIEAALQNLKGTRELMESFVRDMKQHYSPSDQGYKDAEVKYGVARNAFDGYLSSLRMAVLDDRSSGNLSAPAQAAEIAAGDFLTHSVSQLDPTINVRNVSVERAVVFPTRVPDGIKKLSHLRRREALGAFGEEVSWLPWGAL